MSDPVPDDDVAADEEAAEVQEQEHPEEFGVMTAEKATALIPKEIS